MAIVSEMGMLVNIREINYVDKHTGEQREGVSLSLLVPAQNTQYDGVGFRLLELYEPGRLARDKFKVFLQQADGLFLKKVKVDCDMQRRGKFYSSTPLSISAA